MLVTAVELVFSALVDEEVLVVPGLGGGGSGRRLPPKGGLTMTLEGIEE